MLLGISKVILTTDEVITATLSYLSHYNVAVITSSVDNIILFVVTFTLVVAELTIKVVMMASLVAKIIL